MAEMTDAQGIKLLAHVFARMEFAQWQLGPHARALAEACPIAREYFRLRHHAEAGDGLVSLTALWSVAGQPADKAPSEWLAGPDRNYPGRRTEERAGQVWADDETAAWYLEDLSPVVMVADVLEMYY